MFKRTGWKLFKAGIQIDRIDGKQDLYKKQGDGSLFDNETKRRFFV